MTYQLEDLLTQISSPISLVIHVGAGKGAELALYDSMRVKQLVCIEPIPRLAEQLTALSADCQHTEVIVENRAISTKVALLDFYETNNTAFSGFQKPYLWRKYFSDLKLEHEYPIDTWTLAHSAGSWAPRTNQTTIRGRASRNT